MTIQNLPSDFNPELAVLILRNHLSIPHLRQWHKEYPDFPAFQHLGQKYSYNDLANELEKDTILGMLWRLEVASAIKKYTSLGILPITIPENE